MSFQPLSKCQHDILLVGQKNKVFPYIRPISSTCIIRLTSHERNGTPILSAQMFVQQLVQGNNKINIALARCDGKPPVPDGYPAKRDSNAEMASMSWSHCVRLLSKCYNNPGISVSSTKSSPPCVNNASCRTADHSPEQQEDKYNAMPSKHYHDNDTSIS